MPTLPAPPDVLADVLARVAALPGAIAAGYLGYAAEITERLELDLTALGVPRDEGRAGAQPLNVAAELHKPAQPPELVVRIALECSAPSLGIVHSTPADRERLVAWIESRPELLDIVEAALAVAGPGLEDAG